MPVVENTTCFEEHKKRGLCCLKDSCRLNYDYPEDLNCAVIGSQNLLDKDNEELNKQNDYLMSFEDLGLRLGSSRAYAFQVYKKAKAKMKNYFALNDLLIDLDE